MGITWGGNWDGISTCSPPDAMFNCIANDRIAYHLDRNGWIPPIRKYEATPNSDQIISIERLDLPTTPAGYLMAQIPIDGSAEHFYTVEARKFAGYDNQIPGEGIVIFEVDTNRDTPAHIVDADNDGDENDDGVIWLPGEKWPQSPPFPFKYPALIPYIFNDAHTIKSVFHNILLLSLHAAQSGNAIRWH